MKLRWATLMVVFLAGTVSAGDGALRDPTRPADVVASDAAHGEAVALRLDAVLRPVTGRPAVIINGETVKLGGEIEGRKLVAVREASVVLQGAAGREILSLAPEVEKTMRSGRELPAAKRKPGGGA